MKPAYKILLIGGDSLFDSRLCERLALDPKLRIIISGENPQRTLALADEMNRRTASAVLVSEDAGYINGATFSANGGQYMA